MFSGSYVALVTPFTQDGGAIDVKALSRLVEWQLDQGTEGLLVCGSTGEGVLLTQKEHTQVVEAAVQVTGRRVPVIAGVSGIATDESIALAQHSEKAGADGLLVVSPPYIKPTQEGVYEHFKAIENATALPIIAYNNPGRAGTLITEETLVRLAMLPGVVGVKDSADSLMRPLALDVALMQAKISNFCQLSGDDGTVPAFLAQGGHGSISAIANLVPALCAKLHQLWKAGENQQMSCLQQKLYPLIQHVFSETSMACLKAGLAEKGLCHDRVRLPLQPLTLHGRQRLARLMKDLEAVTNLRS